MDLGNLPCFPWLLSQIAADNGHHHGWKEMMKQLLCYVKGYFT
jgi:hypothetical protein